MTLREILRDEWVTFFQTFTSDYADRLVRVGVESQQSKHKIVDTEARELPLREITASLKDKESTIVISLRLPNNMLLRHSVQSVTHVRVAEAEDGTTSALEIESANSQTTMLSLSVLVSQKS
jgi:hypothetical protein